MSTTAITVAVRVRPFNAREIKYKSTLVVNMPDEHNLEMIDPRRTDKNPIPPRKFQFDHCLWTHNPADTDKFVDQKKCYETIGRPMLDNCLKGYNACLFAYGQTGSGKSYSMSGSKEDPGVIPRLCADLFSWATEHSSTHSVFVECSYLEIYNEMVKDLLNPSGINKTLKVRQHPKLGVFVEGLKKIAARNAEDIAKLIDDGTQVRTIASTQMNATSSRSHAILSLSIRVKSTETETASTLHLVDLAGSERAESTGAEGATLKEGANINKSLSTLGMCLGRLADMAEGKKGGHIPFRDSQLTFLLNDSLGGNSKTGMLAALSPADINYEETLSTLRFASITKKIKMVVKVNEDPQQKLIRELREQIMEIKAEIKAIAEGRVYSKAPPVQENEDDSNNNNDNNENNTEDFGAAAGESLPEEVDVDVRRQQLLEELEENMTLMTEATMTEEQRREQEEKERQAHEKQMAELKKGSKSSANLEEENSPKLLLLNEDLRQLRGEDGKPLSIVHSMIKPRLTDGDENDDGEQNDEHSNNNTESSEARQQRSRSRSVANNPKHTHSFSICGPQVTSATNPDEDDADSAIVPWLRLPPISNLSHLMRLEVVVDYHDHKMWLSFEDHSIVVSPTQNDNDSDKREIVFVNGKPLRSLSSSRPSGLQHHHHNNNNNILFIEIHHNDRVIIGGVFFRVFEPISWRVDAICGQDETFIEEPLANVDHVTMLEEYKRKEIENDAFESFVISLFGEEELEGGKLSSSSTAGAHSASPVPGSSMNLGSRSESTGSLDRTPRTMSLLSSPTSSPKLIPSSVLEDVKSTVNTFASESRFEKVQAEERLIQHFPRDVKRELRARDAKDAFKYDGKFALSERAEYLKEKEQEQEELSRRLEEGAAEIEKLQESLQKKQREREEADRKAKEALESEVQAALEKAKREAELKRKQGNQSSNSAVPTQVAAVKTSAQGKLQLARRVHEYEETRRELMSWKPNGPTDPKEKPVYQAMSDSMSKVKPVMSYLEVRRQFDEAVNPTFEANIFKNRIKTGFFSRGGLHPVTVAIIEHFLFYFENGAGLVSPAASQMKMMGFAFILGAEFALVKELDGKPGIRIVSAAPRKANQAKTDAHHALEFAFASNEQREQFVEALEEARLPPADADVALALKKLDGK